MRRRKRHARDAPFVIYRAACGCRVGMCGYTSIPRADRQGVGISFTVCVFVCFVRLRISPPRRQILQGGSSASKAGNLQFLWTLLPHAEAQNRMNRPARPWCNVMLPGFCDSHAYQVRAAYGRRIGMCGYTSVSKDGRTYYKFDDRKIMLINIVAFLPLNML